MTPFETWWHETGRFIDPDHSDVPWFDKRKGLAEYAFAAGAASRDADLEKWKKAADMWSDRCAAMSEGEEVYTHLEVQRMVETARQEEREACASIITDHGEKYEGDEGARFVDDDGASLSSVCAALAAAIRARGGDKA